MNIVHQNIYLAMYFHIVQLLPTFQTSLVLVYCVPAKLRGGGYKQSTHKQVEGGCKFEKHSIQQAHIAQLSLSVARASESRWQKMLWEWDGDWGGSGGCLHLETAGTERKPRC